MQLNEVSQNYDNAARYYDRLTDLAFGRILGLEKYRRHTIDLLGDLDGATVLDIGCGTGLNFSLLVERVGERGKVIGVEYSAGMLEQARRRMQADEGWRNIELVRGDAARLDGVSGPVDAVTAIWVLDIPSYACGLILGVALIPNENPNFEMASKNKTVYPSKSGK